MLLNQKLYLWPVSVHLDFDNIVIEEALWLQESYKYSIECLAVKKCGNTGPFIDIFKGEL